jgi:hypothetical protein
VLTHQLQSTYIYIHTSYKYILAYIYNIHTHPVYIYIQILYIYVCVYTHTYYIYISYIQYMIFTQFIHEGVLFVRGSAKVIGAFTDIGKSFSGSDVRMARRETCR